MLHSRQHTLTSEEIDARVRSHWLLLPLRPFARINWIVLWIGSIAVVLFLQRLGMRQLAGIIAAVYLVYCLYSWIMPSVVRRMVVRR